MKLAIIGAGGHGAVSADTALLTEKWSEIVFLDDRDFAGERILGLSVVGSSGYWKGMVGPTIEFFVAIGGNAERGEVLAAIENRKGRLANIVHPASVVSPFTVLGTGVLVCAGAVVNARARIGRGGIINTGATIDHDCVLAEAVHVSPGAHLAGNVTVGAHSWIGVGAVVKDGVSIGEDCVIGAGAAVVSDVASGQTVVGVPAKPIRS
jgi:sugar O-acyltransferase (sialic acid O-acetyltransferase NeuD family)